MKDKEKTRAQLIKELEELRRRFIQMEAAENECQQAIEEIHRNYQTQAVLNKLLHISLENISIRYSVKCQIYILP